MKKQIIRISPLQTAKVFAALWFAFTIPMILIMAIPMVLMQNSPPNPFSFFLIAMPFIYALIGFVFTLFGAWVYNFVAARLGGIEFTLQDVPND